jgi:hypothetical protein
VNPEKLWRGDYGLPMTYWVYGWVASFIWSLPLTFVTPGSLPAIITVISFVIWMVVWSVGLWNSASKFEGSTIWSFLAKAHVVLPLVGIFATLAVLGIAKSN